MQWMRFQDQEGMIHLGCPRPGGRAEILEGDPFTGLEPTGVLAVVARVLAPLDPPNIFCIGRNYQAHAAETGSEAPQEHPVVFMKPTTAVIGSGEPIRIPRCQLRGPEVDYEAELAVIIGTRCRDVLEERALEVVHGYTLANDVSARRWQKEAGGGQWVRGKGFDSFCPLGPAVITADEIPDPQDLRIRCTLDGQLMQDGHTADMIFSVARLISFLSQDTTLLPGTLILTGTPQGVGFVRDPRVWLRSGTLVQVSLLPAGLRLINRVLESPASG